jgi:IstB-like ATP binding protein
MYHRRSANAATVVVAPLLDRLLHHALTLNIRGKSYRLKENQSRPRAHRRGDRSLNPGGKFSTPTTGEIWNAVDTELFHKAVQLEYAYCGSGESWA